MKIVNDSIFENLYVSKAIYEGFLTAVREREQTGEYRLTDDFYITFETDALSVFCLDNGSWKTKKKTDYFDMTYAEFVCWLEEEDWEYKEEGEYTPLF